MLSLSPPPKKGSRTSIGYTNKIAADGSKPFYQTTFRVVTELRGFPSFYSPRNIPSHYLLPKYPYFNTFILINLRVRGPVPQASS